MGKGRYKSAPLARASGGRFRVTRMAFDPGFSFFQRPPAATDRRKKKQRFSDGSVTQQQALLLLEYSAVVSHCVSHCVLMLADLRCVLQVHAALEDLAALYIEETPSAGRVGVLRRARVSVSSSHRHYDNASSVSQ